MSAALAIEAKDFPQYWATMINEGKLEETVNLYNEASTLLPTFSSKIVSDKAGLTAYFTGLAQREGLFIRIDEASVTSTAIANDCYSVQGFYAFEHQENGVTVAFPSRFTFVVNLADSSPILHHHSSLIPGE